MHNLLTVKETAEYLRIPLPTVYYLVQRGQLPAIQIGGRWRIKKDSLDRDILHEREQGQPTVLVVDDDTGVQGMFKLFLKKTGFSRMVSWAQASMNSSASSCSMRVGTWSSPNARRTSLKHCTSESSVTAVSGQSV